MKQGKIYLYDQFAGLLTEDENGFTFVYDPQYLGKADAEAISLTLPLTDKPYRSNVLFPFFDGLIPEGWLLTIVYIAQTKKACLLARPLPNSVVV